MKKPSRPTALWLLGWALVALLAGAATGADDTDPTEGLREAYDAAATPEAKIAVLEEFLAAHADHEAAPDVLGGVVYLLDEELDRHADAVAAVRTQLGRTTDPQLAFRVKEQLLGLYGDPRHTADMKALVDEMYTGREMSFGDHTTVIEAAIGAEAWALAEERCGLAAATATAEAFAANYPDEEFSDDYIAAAGDNRAGMIATFRGWALANQGRYDEAVATFVAAQGQVRKSYLGLPTNDLYRYWGATDLMRGADEEGLRHLALAAIFAADHDAGDLARSAYIEQHGDDARFESYLWELRWDKARIIEDFTATDYEGVTVSFAESKGKKATMLAFWFPT